MFGGLRLLALFLGAQSSLGQFTKDSAGSGDVAKTVGFAGSLRGAPLRSEDPSYVHTAVIVDEMSKDLVEDGYFANDRQLAIICIVIIIRVRLDCGMAKIRVHLAVYVPGHVGLADAKVTFDDSGIAWMDVPLSEDQVNEDQTALCDGCHVEVADDSECLANCDQADFSEAKMGRTRVTMNGNGGAHRPACRCGFSACDDPHMQGLSGQQIDWSGEDGGWYSLIKDDEVALQVNVRLTAPLPVDFAHRQLMTGLSIISEGHSIIIEASDPYSVKTDGCPEGSSPCLADGGLRITVDGEERNDLLAPTRDEYVANGIEMSASNLPVECRQFGGDKIWARMHEEFVLGRRTLLPETFEDWLLKFSNQAAPDWCYKFLAENGLADVQSNHAVFKIATPTVTIRLDAGVDHQGDGDLDFDGTVLPDLDFWQMDIGFAGLELNHESLSGILGETARPVLDTSGQEVMHGNDALRGTVEDYRVSGPLGETFALHQGA